MLPVPTPTAVAAFTGAVCAAVIGIATSSLVATVVGTTGLTAMAVALAATMPLGRILRHQRLEFAWWLDHSSTTGGAVVPDVAFDVRCYIRHRGRQRLVASSVRPVAPPEARWLDSHARTMHLSPSSRSEFSFSFQAPAAGRFVLQGLAMSVRGPFGLFDVPLYFPNPLAIRVLPKAARRIRSRERAVMGLPMERSGRTSLRRRGGGTELYELRELMPGDPFNAIAWKASARTGKLMVKEVEHEVQETRWLIVDVSGTMRGGPPGSRKLDYAIEVAAAEAKRAIHEGDRVGVATVDGRTLAHVPPGDGVTQLPRIYDALLAATEVVDADLTDVDDSEVAAIVGRYVRHQDGMDFSTRNGWDVTRLVQHVLGTMPGDALSPVGSPSRSELAPLRRFCLARGIPLPYRPDPRDGSKGPGIADALRVASGSPAHIVVITDFDGVPSGEPLVSTVKLLRAHGHQVTFVMPDGPSFAPSPRTPLEHDLHRVYRRSEQRRQREVRAMFQHLGAPVRVVHRPVPADPGVRAPGAQRQAA
jgi:uncharacterized protein (DUF58 family)